MYFFTSNPQVIGVWSDYEMINYTPGNINISMPYALDEGPPSVVLATLSPYQWKPVNPLLVPALWALVARDGTSNLMSMIALVQVRVGSRCDEKAMCTWYSRVWNARSWRWNCQEPRSCRSTVRHHPRHWKCHLERSLCTGLDTTMLMNNILAVSI